MADKIRSIANDLKSPEEKIGQIETDFREMAKKRANSKILDAEKEFNAAYKKLREAGDTEEQARTKAIIQLSSKRIEITAQERAEVEKLKKGAQYSTFEFENMSKFKNAAALMFGVYTKEAEKADKAQLEFSKSLFSLVESEEFNSGIDKIIDKYNKVTVDDDTNKTKTLTDKEKRELEKAAAEKLKIQQTYQDSILALMNEGLDKELKKIGLEYSKKIAAVKGYSKEEIATRENLAKEMQNAVNRFTIQYNTNREKQDIANALEVVQKGSQEELVLKLRQLDMQREAEIDAAEKTGEDVFRIDEKYAHKKQDILEENAAYQIQLIAENAAAEQIVRDQQYQTDMLALKRQLAEKQISKKEYAEQEYQLTLDYIRKTNEAAIDALESELQVGNLNADDKAKIAEKIQKLKADLAQKEAEAEIAAIEEITKADEEARKKRIRNMQNWLQTAQQAIGSIGDLVVTVYDSQITKIEDEQDANDEAYDRDIERIEKQVEYGVLSEEEAEIRKRAAKEKTEAKNRELEKKKQDLARKQAIWDKATSIAQAGIATALAITKALPNFILAAIVGAMGAIQVATIAATPIPSYAEGTKTGAHPGGKALVGDAGKREVVMYKGLAWITPDTPMLVDLPKGAQVFPDVNDFGPVDWQKDSFSPMFSFLGNTDKGSGTTVYNDYSGLERRMDMTNNLLMQSMKQRRREAYNREFDLYILNKL